MNIEGTVTKVIYRNDESGYSIFVLESEDTDITCLGTVPFFNIGDRLTLTGKLIYDDKYGEEFIIESMKLSKPKGKDNIINFLSSSNIKGIGRKTAERIYEEFKEDSIDVVYQNPDKLLTIEGIGKQKLKDIKLSVEETRDARKSLEFLQGLNISYNLAMKIYNKYKESTIEVVKNNPYSLVRDIRGIGFVMADNIAYNMQMDLQSDFRISAGLAYILSSEADLNGHTCLEYELLIKKAMALLKVDLAKVEDLIEKDILAGKLISVNIKDKNFIYLAGLYKAEKSIALTLARKNNDPYIFDIDLEYDLSIFSDEQKEAIKKAFENMVFTITGGPGTGKTTIINAICNILEENGLSFYLAAPTGRAAKRIMESTGQKAYTIHRLLGIKPDEVLAEYNEENPIDRDYLIIDEMSMVDTYLMKNIMAAISEKTALIFVGDSDQLPSVGPGNVLKDILATDISKVRLKKIFRQAGKSNIVVNAHRINEGSYPYLNQDAKDFFFIETSTSNFIYDLVDLVKNRLSTYYKFDPIKDIQILTPSKKTAWGSNNINDQIQKALNDKSPQVKINGRVFRIKDKIMQVRNNYDLKPKYSMDREEEGVYNGDIGIIESIDKDEESLDVLFDDGRKITYKKEDIKDLDLSYAITIHKSQGSEFPCVIIPMMQVAPMLLNRNLLYTGITRAKKIVILLGNKNILKQMVDNDRSNKRYTNLDYWIREMGKVVDD
ncbi:MAG: ATP-dependent RecD-like DNA helicase [Anaerococcus sp.]|nr:ATP-dependent RecD-like DNA helicase [Anaerococcus sp.]